MKTSLCTGVLVAFVASVSPTVRGGEAWFQEFDEGRAAAKAQGKDLLIDFGGSDWCAPCKWLKERVFSKPEFIERATHDFVLVDIDLLMRKGAAISADRKERYEKLQERYEIATFPSVLLATSDGRPYARTTYHQESETPEQYWKHLVPLHERGQRFRREIARAKTQRGHERAEALANALGEIDARFVTRFHAETLADLRAADPSDSTGYLAFVEGRRALDEFQAKIDVFKGAISVDEVNALIARKKLRGESLQEALVLRATAELLAGDDRQALRTFAAVLDAQASRTRFDHGDFVPLDAASIAKVRRRIVEGEVDKGDGVALYYALHRIFAFELPDPYEVCCGHGFRPSIRVRETMGNRYGSALIRSTEGLSDDARARALAKGLDGTFFAAQGSIREIILDRIPALVGKETAKKILPGSFYPRWIR